MEPIVNFFVVGYPKSGSTTLYNLLRNHPKVFLPEFKEPKYFLSDLFRESDQYHGGEVFGPIRTLEDYHYLYSKSKGEVGIGDISPWYIYSKEAAANLYNYNPDAKIIILIREPISFLQSLHFEMLAHFYEDEEDFLTALSLESFRKKGEKVPKTVKVPSYLYYSEWIKYAEAIDRYISLFDVDQVKVIIFEEMIKDEVETVKSMLHFLDISSNDHQFPREIDRNPSHTVKHISVWKLIKQPAVYRIAKKIIPVKLYGNVNKFLFDHLTEKKKKPSITKEEFKSLQQQYLDLVISTSKLLNQTGLIDIDLPKYWGYTE